MTKNSETVLLDALILEIRRNMRMAVMFLVVLAIASSGAAQTIGLPLPSIGLPLPSIGLPLPQIGLPLPPTGLPLLQRPSQPATRSSPPPRDRGIGRSHRARGASTFVFLAPTLGWPYSTLGWPYSTLGWPYSGAALPGPPPPVAVPAPPPATGRLTVELQQAIDPQVFIDGAYVGTLGDLGDEVVLEPGVHRLELRADGYAPNIVDVRIVAGRTTTYRASLDAGSASSDRPLSGVRPAPPPPATIYMIPGCYVGNLPPQQVALPAGCDPSRVVVFPSSK